MLNKSCCLPIKKSKKSNKFSLEYVSDATVSEAKFVKG